MTTTNKDQTRQTTGRKLTIMTYNANGLFEDEKRQQIFQNLENKNAQIILLQETHSNEQIIKKWEKEWKGSSFWHSGKIAKSCGVAILFQKDLNIETSTISTDEEGRIMSITFILEKQLFQITNIYAPTNPTLRKKFYKNLLTHFNKNNGQNLILGGDFNMVEDLYLDRQGGTPSNIDLIGQQYLQTIKETYNLIDNWRKIKRTKRIYTFHNYNNSICSRIDRIYTTKNIKLNNATIIPNNISDHDIITLTITITKQKPKGRGIWKLNATIVKEKNFTEIFRIFWQNWQKEKPKYNSINQWWDSGKIYFQILAIEYSKKQNHLINSKLQKLTDQIIHEKTKTTPNLTNINNWQQELEDIENYKIQGSIIRSKEKITNQEQPNKFFYQLEKQKQTKKHIKKLKDNQENYETNFQILKHCKNYYQKLYTKHKTDTETQRSLSKTIDKKVTEKHNIQLTKRLTKTEIKEVIHQMEDQKSPGIDGIPIEFYKEYYNLLEDDLHQLYTNILFTEKQTPVTMTQAIITLLRKNKDGLKDLKHWRPISLLDYKILFRLQNFDKNTRK